ncbi:MAG: HDIG domain-containing metalloprotein [Bacteroidota bacterium]
MKNFVYTIGHKHEVIYKIILMIVCVLGIVYFIPKEGKFRYEYQKGKPWLHEDLIAPFDFAIYKSDEELAKEKLDIKQKSKQYFKVNPKVYNEVIASVISDFNDNWFKSVLSKDKFAQEKSLDETKRILSEIYKIGIIQYNEVLEGKADDYTIFLVENNLAEEVELKELFTIVTVQNFVNENIEKNSRIDQNFIKKIIENSLKQNVFFDANTSSKALNDLLDNISLNRDMKQKGERIISRGDLIDENDYQVLESLKKEYLTQYGGSSKFYFIVAGQIVLVSICIAMVFMFLYLFRRDIFLNNQKVTFILLEFFLISLMTNVAIKLNIASVYILPFSIMPMLTRAFFDTRVALFMHIASMLILGLVVPNPFEFVLLQLIGGIFTIFSIINMRNRKQVFVSVAIIFAVYCLTYLGFYVIREGSLKTFDWYIIQWFFVSSTLTLFVYPLIYVFEKLFGFISDVSLMELSDINTPLLRELSIKAPGTFQHSLQVANLAEEAAIKVGGSALLVRVGALYHDIGKMENPMYFIENQFTGVNPHDELTFEESASVIIGHVAKGIEIAKKNNLPDQIIDFIRTHHGETKAEYFYRSHLKNYPDEVIDVKAFQYPGPLPFSKETAILMMADSVEAASRSIKKYDAESIDSIVERVIGRQVEENQFVNSDITFKDITIIKKILKKKLMNIYHLRIEYPK